ncbi:MAG TPA: hypothetical protein VFV78_14500 [Vicinamibacterales bacterium]|nr:hypothetical protein [Vicinamibacterales bacterium]
MKQFHEQRNRGRTYPAEDLERHPLEVLIRSAQIIIWRVKKPSQQWQRTLRSVGERGLGTGPDVRVVG